MSNHYGAIPSGRTVRNRNKYQRMPRKKNHNHIVEYEQEQDIIDILKAYKKVNSKAKFILYLGFWLCIVILAVANYAKFMYASTYGDIKYIAAGVAVTTAVISICLNRRSSKLQYKAAVLLTQYETALYEFPWKSNYGTKVTPEEIVSILNNDKDNRDYATWFDHTLTELGKNGFKQLIDKLGGSNPDKTKTAAVDSSIDPFTGSTSSNIVITQNGANSQVINNTGSGTITINNTFGK